VSRRGGPIMGRTPCVDYPERRALTGRRCALHLHGARGLPHCTLSPVYGRVAWWAAEDGRSTERGALCACNGWIRFLAETPSPRSSSARPTRRRPTNGPGASGAARCATRRFTSRILSPWISSSKGRAASMSVLPDSLGALVDVRQLGPRDGRHRISRRTFVANFLGDHWKQLRGLRGRRLRPRSQLLWAGRFGANRVDLANGKNPTYA
jgi:hypothetical protein